MHFNHLQIIYSYCVYVNYINGGIREQTVNYSESMKQGQKTAFQVHKSSNPVHWVTQYQLNSECLFIQQLNRHFSRDSAD